MSSSTPFLYPKRIGSFNSRHLDLSESLSDKQLGATLSHKHSTLHEEKKHLQYSQALEPETDYSAWPYEVNFKYVSDLKVKTHTRHQLGSCQLWLSSVHA